MRKGFLASTFILALCVLLYATVPVTDNFNRANSASLGASWTEIQDLSLEILNNECANTANGTVGTAANATNVGTNDQYAQATINSTAAAGTNIGCVTTRTENSLSGVEYYSGTVDADTGSANPHELIRIIAGTSTTLLSSATAYTAGEVLRLETSGIATSTVAALKKNGTHVTGSPVTDTGGYSNSSHRKVGIRSALFSANTTRMDDWEAGDMGWSLVSVLTGAQNKTSTSAWSPVAFTVAVGEVVVVVVAGNNITTTDGNSNDHTSITTDDGGNFTKLREFTNGQGGAASGATVSVWARKITTVTSLSITINFASAIAAMAYNGFRFVNVTGNTFDPTLGGTSDLANDAADAGSIALSGLTLTQYIFVRAGAVEDPFTTYTATAEHTESTNQQTSGGAAASNMAVRSEFAMLTATADTTDPTTIVADQASTMIAIKELVAAAGAPKRLLTLGIGGQN